LLARVPAPLSAIQDARGFVSLRRRADRGSAQAAAPHELQLPDLSPPGRPLGLLRPEQGEDRRAQPIDRAQSRMGVNFRNFDASVIESTRVRKFDGAVSWKFLE
jgi:hypothetical protein